MDKKLLVAINYYLKKLFLITVSHALYETKVAGTMLPIF